jgi:hypothetical protein
MTTTIATTTTTKTRFINGANELKQFIQEYATMTHEMKMRFETDLDSPLTKVDPAPICRPLHDFNARQCAVRHRDFIRKVTRESKELSAAEANVITTLATAEKLRKMLVTNKQHRKTEHKNNRRVANSIPESESMKDNHLTLTQMDDASRQHHRTVARNILEEVNRVLEPLMSGRFIVAYQDELDKAVAEIIQHSDKCRRYIQRTMRLAVIEFCASRWFHSKQDAMDSAVYYLTAEEDETFTGPHPFSGITVDVQNVHDNRHTMTLHLDNDSSTREILTEEAIQAFEWEQQSLWFDKQAEMERHANYEQELAQFYADQARDAAAAVAAASVAAKAEAEEEEKKWDELFKECEEESWNASGGFFDEMEMEMEMESGSDYDDGYWG